MHTQKIFCSIPVDRAMKRGFFCTITITAAADIDAHKNAFKAYANASDLMGQFLLMLHDKIPYGLLELSGSIIDANTTDTSKAVLIVSEKDIEKANAFSLWFQEHALKCFTGSNGPILLELTVDDEEEIELVLEGYSQSRTVSLLSLMPEAHLSSDNRAHEQTHWILRKEHMHLENEHFQLQLFLQSNSEFMHHYILSKIQQLTEQMGGTAVYE